MSARPDPAKRALWQQRLDRFDQQPVPVPDFCATEGVSVPAFYYWRRKLRPADPAAELPPGTPLFVPLTLAPAAAGPLEVLLPGGLVVRVPPAFDPDALRRILDALR